MMRSPHGLVSILFALKKFAGDDLHQTALEIK